MRPGDKVLEHISFEFVIRGENGDPKGPVYRATHLKHILIAQIILHLQFRFELLRFLGFGICRRPVRPNMVFAVPKIQLWSMNCSKSPIYVCFYSKV